MKTKNKVVALGEILIDYTPLPPSQTGMAVFEQNAGGAPANVLACISKLGGETAFIGKVGCDMQGEFLKDTLVQAGINSSGLVFDENYFTTLAFVSLSTTGERSFSFARKPGADTQLNKTEINEKLLDEAKIFHFGSLSLTHECSKEATLYALDYAKNKGAIISYDPNYRPLLWKSEEIAQETMKAVLPLVDILKISDEECMLISGESDPKKACEKLKEIVPIVIITLGKDGAIFGIKNNEDTIIVQGFKAEQVVDTTGAGDSFWGAILYQISNSNESLQNLTQEKLVNFIRFANATASICVEKRGATLSMPNISEIEKRINI